MSQFQLEIMTPDGVAFSGLCESLLVRTDRGDVEIMRGHADYFAAVDTGRIRLTVDGRQRFAAASGGFLSVSGGTVRLALITFEYAEDIDAVRASIAKQKAEAAIAAAKDVAELKIAKAKLSRALSRLSVSAMNAMK